MRVVLAVAGLLPVQVTHAEPDAPAISATVQPPCDTASFDAAWNLIPIGLGGTLTFNCGAAPVSINMSGTKTITKQVTIDGGGKIMLNGNFITRHFVVNAGAALTLTNITIAGGGGGFSLDAGGAVQNFGTLTVLTSTFHTNQTGDKYGGGAIYSRGTLVIDNSIFRNNAAGAGGAIFNEKIAGSSGRATIENSHIFSNTATGSFGAGVFNNGQLRMDRVLIETNRFGAAAPSGHGGAGLANMGLGNAVLIDVTIRSNSVGDSGGGAGIMNSGLLSYGNGSVSLNETGYLGSGGGIHNVGEMRLDDVLINGNRATVGGGIYARDEAGDAYRNVSILNRLSVDGNVAEYGAGVMCSSCIMFFRNSSISENSAFGDGGGLSVSTAYQLEMDNVTIAKNTALGSGGGIVALSGGVLTLRNVTLAENSAEDFGGGGLSLSASLTVTLLNTIIANSLAGGNCVGAAVINASNSLSSDNTCALIGTGNKLNTDPLLNPLGNYGGSTPTYLPKAGSPAIDGVIGSNAPATDQRGFPRPQGAGYDIGAVERQPSDDTVTLTPRIRIPIVVR